MSETMTMDHSTVHASFTLERTYAAAPAKVFKAFADPEAKARWFRGPDEWGNEKGVFEFREGGRESNRTGPKDGPMHVFECRYYDIVPNQRIVYAYEMYLDKRRISVSLATIELKPAGAGTKLTITEHGAFLDGYDDAKNREQGTNWLLDKLGTSLQ
jgi:uncharacterized protein YndB with AHSA1/START domain